MASSISLLFSVTAGFAVTELSAKGVRQWPVLADRPVAYYRLGEAPGCIVAVDLSANAHDGVPEGTSRLKVLEWDVPFAIEAWVQLIDDYQINSKILGEAKSDTGAGYGLDFALSEADPTNDGLFVARGVLRGATIYNYPLTPRLVESRHQVETEFRTGMLTTLLGLALILFGLVPVVFRRALKFRGSDAGLSRAGIFQVGVVNLRRRSESELNSFSARYATVEVRAGAPLAGCGVRSGMR
jgi:hypothetical protein